MAQPGAEPQARAARRRTARRRDRVLL